MNDDLGAEVMIKKSLPPEQRIYTMAHELKHHLVDKVPARQVVRVKDDPTEIGAQVFAAELIYPEADYLRDIKSLGVAVGSCSATDIVKLKQTTETTLSFTALGVRAELLGLAPKDSLKSAKWLILRDQIFGEPEYKRIVRFKKARAQAQGSSVFR